MLHLVKEVVPKEVEDIDAGVGVTAYFPHLECQQVEAGVSRPLPVGNRLDGRKSPLWLLWANGTHSDVNKILISKDEKVCTHALIAKGVIEER